jgi:hypothetical protein
VRTKADDYRLLQNVREQADAPEAWQEWVLYMLTAVEQTAQQSIRTTTAQSLIYDPTPGHRVSSTFNHHDIPGGHLERSHFS